MEPSKRNDFFWRAYCFSKVAADFAASNYRSYFSDLGVAGIRCISIDVVLLHEQVPFSNDVILLGEQWGIRKQRGKPAAMMKAAWIGNRHGKYSETSKLLQFCFGAEFSSDVEVDLSTSAST
jgi:hypothetical protein